MTLVPTNRGIVADQALVPVAGSLFPAELVHFTEVTPTASFAVPLMEIVADDVETIVVPGLAIFSAGAVVSAGAAGPVAGGSCGRGSLSGGSGDWDGLSGDG